MAEARPDKQSIFQAENVVVHKTQPQGGDVPSIGRVHEERDVPIDSLLKAVAYLVIFTALTFVACWGLFELFATQAVKRDPQLSPLAEDRPKPSPALQSDPPLDMEAFRKQEDSAMAEEPGIGGNGTLRMSVDDAMDAIARHGLPHFTATTAATDTSKGRADTSMNTTSKGTVTPENAARR